MLILMLRFALVKNLEFVGLWCPMIAGLSQNGSLNFFFKFFQFIQYVNRQIFHFNSHGSGSHQ